MFWSRMALRKHSTVYDDNTSEIVGQSDKPVRGVPHWPGEFWRMELATAQMIRQHRKELGMLDVALFFWLVENMGPGNVVENTTQVMMAEDLETSATAVCRSMRTLMEMGWVHKVGASNYRVDLRLGWNGTIDGRRELAKIEGKKAIKKNPRQKLSLVEE